VFEYGSQKVLSEELGKRSETPSIRFERNPRMPSDRRLDILRGCTGRDREVKRATRTNLRTSHHQRAFPDWPPGFRYARHRQIVYGHMNCRKHIVLHVVFHLPGRFDQAQARYSRMPPWRPKRSRVSFAPRSLRKKLRTRAASVDNGRREDNPASSIGSRTPAARRQHSLPEA